MMSPTVQQILRETHERKYNLGNTTQDIFYEVGIIWRSLEILGWKMDAHGYWDHNAEGLFHHRWFEAVQFEMTKVL